MILSLRVGSSTWPGFRAARISGSIGSERATHNSEPLAGEVMGKHERGYARVDKDLYPTPSWVVDALAEHIDLIDRVVWECATGAGQMAEALKAVGATVYA